MTDEELAILLESATDWLVAKAADVPAASDGDCWKRDADEMAALARLITGLESGQVLSGDAVARELVARTTSETNHLHDLEKKYRRELDLHKAWVALLARFVTAQGGEDGPDVDHHGSRAERQAREYRN
ncbi:MAG TPA: hypothetical protein VHZ54_14505 [Solirubrobacterales bacterium]|jgi:hypothetical protein|nr:hypothetical protein [Solirubrobacterales bacterium]